MLEGPRRTPETACGDPTLLPFLVLPDDWEAKLLPWWERTFGGNIIFPSK